MPRAATAVRERGQAPLSACPSSISPPAFANRVGDRSRSATTVTPPPIRSGSRVASPQVGQVGRRCGDATSASGPRSDRPRPLVASEHPGRASGGGIAVGSRRIGRVARFDVRRDRADCDAARDRRHGLWRQARIERPVRRLLQNPSCIRGDAAAPYPASIPTGTHGRHMRIEPAKQACMNQTCMKQAYMNQACTHRIARGASRRATRADDFA